MLEQLLWHFLIIKLKTIKSINVIHESGSKKEAIIEIERFFKDRRKL